MRLPYRFGKYVLLEKIAQGGMAEIYRAKYYGERGFAKEVAVKRILPALSERRDIEDMLIDEAKVLVHLQHQNIVQVFELGRDDDFLFISMEYVNGIDLRLLYKKISNDKIRVPERFACFIIVAILKGLEFAHRQKGDDGQPLKIVHRDVSPQNILLSYNGEVKLADFGIAKGLHRNYETTAARLKGKYAYMSPEQASGGDVDRRSDLYSVGIVFYEIMTGSRLFLKDSDFETIRCIRESILPDDWEIKVSLDVRKILKKALAKDVEERYQTAAEFLVDLNKYITLKKFYTHELELSEYLNQLFAGERYRKIEENQNGEVRTKFMDVAVVKGIRKLKWAIHLRYVAILVVSVFSVIASANKGDVGGDNLYREKDKQIMNWDVNREVEKQKHRAGPTLPDISVMGGGIINIDSEPSMASGSLEFGGDKREFTTPFVLTGIDVDKEIEVNITLYKTGFASVVDDIVLNKSNPTVTKKYELIAVSPGLLSIQARPWGYIYIPGVLGRRESPVRGVKMKPGTHEVKVYYSPSNTWVKATVDIKANASHQCVADFTNKGTMWCK